MNDPERVRALLENHGYRDSKAEAVIHVETAFLEPWVFGPCGSLFAPTGDEPGWNNALAHFLNDKARTGARMKELPRPVAEAMVRQDGFWADPDASIATLWLHSFGLEDPRGGA